jgi:histidine triad (HIT) family protein
VVASGEETDLNKRSDIVFENNDVVAYISPKWWVNNPGNVMVIPKRHVENVYDISDELLSKVYMVGKQSALAMKETYKCDGTSFRQHNEPAGNQDVWHFHLHVFPRYKDDDLYLNHKNKRFVDEEERAPYAEKLRSYFIG